MTTTTVELCSSSKAQPISRHTIVRRKAASFAFCGALALAFVSMPNRASAEESQRPPPNNVEYFQYGVAVAVEKVGSGGDVCPTAAKTPCILGSGGGLAIRMGYRSRGPWYLGGAYEFARMDSANLLRLAILQQLRGEVRYYLDTGNRATPYAVAGFGAAVYGSEWDASTIGPTAGLGLGLEFQVTQSTVIGAAVGYRGFALRRWTDGAGEDRANGAFGFGLAHLIAFELTLELRSPLARW